jgi:hypothetical protein
MASSSSTDILERFQSEALRTIVDAPWNVPNTIIQTNFQTPRVKEEILHYSSQCSARINAHPTDLAVSHVFQTDNGRLRRHLPNDLSTRFLAKMLSAV